MSDISINSSNVNHISPTQPIKSIDDVESSKTVTKQQLVDSNDVNTEPSEKIHSFKRGLRDLKNSPNKV